MTLFELEAILRLDASQFSDGVGNATRESSSFAKAIGADADSIKGAFTEAFSFSVGQLMADGFKQAIGALWDFADESIGVASDLEETNSKIDAIFGSMSQNVHNWARTTKDQFGIGEFAAKGYAGQLASLLSADSLGLTTEQIYEMSTGLVELAGDLASFHNMSFDTVWTKLLSGMRGETEAIEDLGVDVRASAMAAYLGINTDDWGKLDQQTRTLTTYEYILKNTTVAQGDFVRTQDQYANQMRIFNENITQLKAQLGEGLLPVMTDLVTWFNALFEDTGTAEETVAGIGDTFISTYSDIAAATASANSLIDSMDRLLENGLSGEEEAEWNALVSALLRDIPALGDKFGETAGEITGGTEALRGFVTAMNETAMSTGAANAYAEYYEELGKSAARLADEQADMEDAKADFEGGTQVYYETWREALSYLYGKQGLGTLTDEQLQNTLASEQGVATAYQALYGYAYGWHEDPTAKTYYELLQKLKTPEELEATYKKEQAEYETQKAEYEALKSQVDVLVGIVDTLVKQATTPPEVTVNNYIDGDPVAAKVEQRISRNARNKSLTVAVMK